MPFLSPWRVIHSQFIENKSNSEKTKLKIWRVLQSVQKYYCSVFNEASIGICLLSGMGTYCLLALIAVRELYSHCITALYTGLSPFITLNQKFLTGYKEIHAVSTLCQNTLKEEKAWWRRCQNVVLLNNLELDVIVNYIFNDWKQAHICKQLTHSGFLSKTAAGFLFIRGKQQSNESCNTFCTTQKQNSRQKSPRYLQLNVSL